ncbi:gene transfer agent family protein [Brevundimonas sp. UBA5866]|uniref:gene transfer agent family protein n=1 Tax=Brevundimonas sp. UBA5866 TaxID=1946132 RepID=UPI0025B7D8F5|nr:gene transfer agent family protein [Brevundimonas sp. UBA5866]
MSRAAEVTLAFGGEERLFRLPIGRIRALQEKTDCGPMELIQRFTTGRWRVDDVRETILQGLIGGGLSTHEATQVILGHFDDTPIFPHVTIAQAIVASAVIGVEDEALGESAAGVGTNSRSRDTSSASAPSTEPEPS